MLSANPEETSEETSPFLDVSALSGLEAMRFSTKRRIDGHYSGRHVAQRHGGAGQFIDSREYAPGDDLRRLDWPAMGRTGRAYVRLYQDETNLSCILNIDASGSMHFGAKSATDASGSKLEWAQFFATALSHLIVQGRDQVGISVASDSLMVGKQATVSSPVDSPNDSTNYMAPSASPRQVRRLHERISELRALGSTPLGQSLQELFLKVRRRAVLMVISDFLVQPLDETLRALRQFRGRGWETIAVHVVHPLERSLPDGIAFRFAGMEGEAAIDCRPSEIRDAYRAKFASHCSLVRDGLLGSGCDYRVFSTDQSYLDAVRFFMVPRSG